MSIKRRSFPAVVGLMILLTVGVHSQDATPSRSESAIRAGVVDDSANFAKDLSEAGRGDAAAELRAGKAYYFGMHAAGGARDYAEAYKWFNAAYNQGLAAAAPWVGACYVFGFGVKQDIEKGMKLIQSAAKENDSAALTFLGLFYLHGTALQKDEKAAMGLFSRASESGNAIAQLNLARMYRNGFVIHDGAATFVPGHGDYSAAVKWYRSAATANIWAAEFELGEMMESGLGTPKDPKAAVVHYTNAARKGFAPAQLRMASWHEEQAERGEGAWHLSNAYFWYTLAARSGNAAAQRRLPVVEAQLNPDQKRDALALLARYAPNSSVQNERQLGSNQ